MKEMGVIVLVGALICSTGCQLQKPEQGVKEEVDVLVKEAMTETKIRKYNESIKSLDELTELSKKDNRYKDYMYEILDSKDRAYDKGVVILALAVGEDEGIGSYLVEMLGREDMADRIIAANYIGDFKIKGAARKLYKMSQNDPNPKVRVVAKMAHNKLYGKLTTTEELDEAAENEQK